MAATICFFEDFAFKKMLPLVYMRPVYDLRCGILTLRQKISALYPKEKPVLLCRDYLEKVTVEKNKWIPVNDLKSVKYPCLFLNGGLMISEKLKEFSGDEMGIINGRIAYLYLTEKNRDLIDKKSFFDHNLINVLKLKVKTVDAALKLVNYPWDLVNSISEGINSDFRLLVKKGSRGKGFVDKRVVIYGKKENVFVDEDAKVEAGVVIHAEDGPVYVGRGANIRAHAIIDSPCYIGDKSIIDGAMLRNECCIGPVCRIGGEVERSIIQSYSNKHHEGFLGHAFVAEWVNIAALVTNSDLKNNYGNVRIMMEGQYVDTGTIKMGCFIGDHTKIGIGTLINTGSVIGVGCNLFGGETINYKHVPSFLWGSRLYGFQEYRVDKMVNDAKTIMGRRKIPQTEAEIELLKKISHLTVHEREAFFKQKASLRID